MSYEFRETIHSLHSVYHTVSRKYTRQCKTYEVYMKILLTENNTSETHSFAHNDVSRGVFLSYFQKKSPNHSVKCLFLFHRYFYLENLTLSLPFTG